MIKDLWGRQSTNKRPHFCRERTFVLFTVCVTQILVGGGGGSSYSSFPPNPGHSSPPTLIYLGISHLSRRWADLPTDLWAIQPTGRELTDFKKPVSKRVNESKLSECLGKCNPGKESNRWHSALVDQLKPLHNFIISGKLVSNGSNATWKISVCLPQSVIENRN